MDIRTTVSSVLGSYARATVSGQLENRGIMLFEMVRKNYEYAYAMYRKGEDGYKEKAEKLKEKLFQISRYYPEVCNVRTIGELYKGAPTSSLNNNIKNDDYLNRMFR